MLLEKASVQTFRENAQEVQLQVNSDLTLMRTLPFHIWRTNVAARYAADPIVMELLNLLDSMQSGVQNKIPRNISSSLTSSSEAEAQPWTTFFQ